MTHPWRRFRLLPMVRDAYREVNVTTVDRTYYGVQKHASGLEEMSRDYLLLRPLQSLNRTCWQRVQVGDHAVSAEFIDLVGEFPRPH